MSRPRGPAGNSRPALRTAVTALLFVCVVYRGFAIEDPEGVLIGEFWCDLEPAVQDDGGPYPLTADAAIRRVLEEARFVFSGMIYGFAFLYTPSDTARQVAEVFVLDPVAEIPWGDDNLSAYDTRVRDGRYFALIRYDLQEFQRPWIRGWESFVHPTAGGSGTGEMLLGYGEKITAYRNAVKDAIRNHLRSVYPNRPREVTGEVVLADPPYCTLDAGAYRALVSVRLRISKVVPYLQQ